MLSGSAIACSADIVNPSCNHLVLETLIRRFWEQEETYTHQGLSADWKLWIDLSSNNKAFGRYVVERPFRLGNRELGESRPSAIRRFISLEKKKISHPQEFAKYKEFIHTYKALGHMEIIPPNEIGDKLHCYLPHHAVFKPDSTTTKLRVVFDASAATTNGTSLNELMLTAPRLQEKLATILLRWRKFKVALSADIEKMYKFW